VILIPVKTTLLSHSKIIDPGEVVVRAALSLQAIRQLFLSFAPLLHLTGSEYNLFLEITVPILHQHTKCQRNWAIRG